MHTAVLEPMFPRQVYHYVWLGTLFEIISFDADTSLLGYPFILINDIFDADLIITSGKDLLHLKIV